MSPCSPSDGASTSGPFPCWLRSVPCSAPNVAPGIIAVIGGIVALWMMDRVNRRTTFVLGFGLTTVCQVLIGIASLALPEGNPARPFVILALVVAFVIIVIVIAV